VLLEGGTLLFGNKLARALIRRKFDNDGRSALCVCFGVREPKAGTNSEHSSKDAEPGHALI